jgi:DNA-binding NarL/FixJ family response regulator
VRRPRIVLADDHALVAGALERVLSDCYDVVGRFGDGRTLVKEASVLKPEVIVLDISMPLLNGLEAARQIKRQLPNVKLIFVTMNEDPELAAEAFRAGASGYLLKSSACAELETALKEVLQGRSYVTPVVTRELVGSLLENPTQRNTELTSRQREVLQLLAEGYSMKEVATQLNLTPRTVAFHKYKMMEQLKLKSSAELVQYAVKHRIV